MLTTVPRDIREAGSYARLRACIARARQVPGRHNIALGKPSDTLHLVISGMAARARTLRTGARQITALILPGDPCDLWEHFGGHEAGTIETVTPCTIGEIPREVLFEQGRIRPEWSAFVLRTLAQEAEIATEWIVSLGRRSAYEAAAHLFCELWTRFDAIGQTNAQSFPFPLTQVDLGDVLGLTPVHTNRTLRDLRNAGLLSVAKRRATVHDHAGLREAADFDPSYLQMDEGAVSAPDRHSDPDAQSRAGPASHRSSPLAPTVEA